MQWRILPILESNAGFWMRRQAAYDLAQARRKVAAKASYAIPHG